MLFALKLNRGKFIQIFVGILGSISTLFSGIYVGWTSPLVTILLSEDTPLKSGPMSQDQVSLMSSLLYVGSIIGAFLAGWLVNRLGRKWTLLLTIIPQLIAHSMVILAREPIMFLVSRATGGTIVGSTLVVSPIFVAEISEKKMKTILGNLAGLSFNIGICLGKSLTDLLGFHAVPVACLILTVILIGFVLILPETPEYLIFRDKLDEAEKSLKFYRGVKVDDPLPEKYLLEFEELKIQVQQRDQNISLKDFREGSTILAIIMSLILILNLNFAGIRIEVSFTETLLKDSGIPVDISLVDVIISLLQILGSVASILLVRWIGIRLSLLVFYLISFLAYIASGVHYFLHENGQDMLSLKWSFLMSISLSIIVPGTMILILSMTCPSLILPVKIKGSVLGILNIISLLVAFFMMQYCLSIVDSLGNSFLMGAFGVWCLFGMIFTYFFIPEISKMTSSEIISELGNRIPKRFHVKAFYKVSDVL